MKICPKNPEQMRKENSQGQLESLRSLWEWRTKSALTLCLLAVSAVTISCSDTPSPTQAAKPYVPPTTLTLDAHTARTDDGRVVISGTTNLPDGLKMWIE